MDVKKLVETDCSKDWRKFSKMLFELEDADPGYLLLKRAELNRLTKLRYVLAWCTYYNPGIAAIACQFEGAKFYEYLRSIYTTAQRASERRHFRGQAGYKALAQWQSLYPHPEDMILECYADTYLGVRANMKHMAQMGDYFYWKLADIWDTVFDKPVDFTGCEKYMPKVPQQGAELIFGLEVMNSELDTTHDSMDVMPRITSHVSKIKYPAKGRPLALQEAETVCCVFKQHYNGDYKFGFRSAKAWKRLKGVETPTATKLINGLYEGGVWDRPTLARIAEHL